MRNTLRFLLANTSDFDPGSDAIPVGELLELDRYALAQVRVLADACRADYDRYEFHLVVQRLQTYCSEISAASTSTSSRTACTRQRRKAALAGRRKPRCSTSATRCSA